jgi:molecular chaperone GrpE
MTRGCVPKPKPRMCAAGPRKTLPRLQSSIDRFARELLAVKDSLEAALAIETASVESLRSGTELTLKQLVAAFEKSALTEVNPLGEKFDPHRHQAISVVESEQEPNTVVTVLQKGYLLADRVLRPALVIVAKGSDLKSAQ